MKKKKIEPPATIACTFAEYVQIEGVNWSSLKHMVKSPMHYLFAQSQPPEDTATLMAGRAAHTAILEPDRFPLEYAVYGGATRRGSDWEAFKAANEGRSIIKSAEYMEALSLRDAVRGHKVASRYLSDGLPERSITWTDEATGIKCKGRVDYLRGDGFVDLKTTANLDERRFQNTFHDLGYHMQLAFYLRGLKALGMLAPVVRLVAVEASDPHDVAAFIVDPGVLATGDEKITELLALLVDCQKRKKWPGRYPEESTLFLPGWAYSDVEADFDGDFGLSIPTATPPAPEAA